MKKYLIKRIASLIPVLLIMSFVVFMLIHMIPGDPARVILGDEASEEAVAALRQSMGLDKPLPEQYLRWLGRILSGDLGHSLFMKGSMVSIITSHLVPTLELTVCTMVLAFAVSLPLGMLAAAKKNGLTDHAVSVLAMLGISVPSFLLSLFLILIFSVGLRWLPPAGYKPIAAAGLKTSLRYMILPSLAMGLVESGLLIRMTRSSLLDVLGADYIRMVRAKGVSELLVVARHALKNASLPILTAMGQTFVGVMSAATVAETIFNVPGLGQLIVSSVSRRDYEVIQAAILLAALINVLTYLAVDLLYCLIDPRVRLGK